MNFRKFSASDDERLVHSVKACPVLYNNERFFTAKNSELIRESWRTVTSAVGRDEEACKKRWRDIRDHYFKVKKKQQRSGDRRWCTRWPLYKSLSFLDLVKRKRRPQNDDQGQGQESRDDGNSIEIYEPETTFKVEEDSQAESPSQLEYVDVMVPPPAEADTNFCPPSDTSNLHFLEDPRPWGPGSMVETTTGRRVTEEDDVDMFMKSVALTVKRFPPKMRAEAKFKILSAVTQLEFPVETQTVEKENS